MNIIKNYDLSQNYEAINQAYSDHEFYSHRRNFLYYFQYPNFVYRTSLKRITVTNMKGIPKIAGNSHLNIGFARLAIQIATMLGLHSRPLLLYYVVLLVCFMRYLLL